MVSELSLLPVVIGHVWRAPYQRHLPYNHACYRENRCIHLCCDWSPCFVPDLLFIIVLTLVSSTWSKAVNNYYKDRHPRAGSRDYKHISSTYSAGIVHWVIFRSPLLSDNYPDTCRTDRRESAVYMSQEWCIGNPLVAGLFCALKSMQVFFQFSIVDF